MIRTLSALVLTTSPALAHPVAAGHAPVEGLPLVLAVLALSAIGYVTVSRRRA